MRKGRKNKGKQASSETPVPRGRPQSRGGGGGGCLQHRATGVVPGGLRPQSSHAGQAEAGFVPLDKGCKQNHRHEAPPAAAHDGGVFVPCRTPNAHTELRGTNTPPRTQLLCAAHSFSFCSSRPMAFTQSHTAATREAQDVGSSQTNGRGTDKQNPTRVKRTLTSAS